MTQEPGLPGTFFRALFFGKRLVSKHIHICLMCVNAQTRIPSPDFAFVHEALQNVSNKLQQCVLHVYCFTSEEFD